LNFQNPEDELTPEYHFDYQKAKPNRFVDRQGLTVVVLDEDVAQVFTTPESVNKALRALNRSDAIISEKHILSLKLHCLRNHCNQFLSGIV
jgi:predicted transcriptional regulator